MPGPRLSPLALAATLYASAEPTLATPFDAQTLRLRGIDPSLAEYLSSAAGFTAGIHTVKLTVNGQPRGLVKARFDEAGQLCFERSLLEAAQLRAPGAGEECGDFLEQYPETQVELRPESGDVLLRVPDQALPVAAADLSGVSTGGVAGLLNYDLQALHNSFDGRRSRYLSAHTEAGLNAGDWVLRSRQFYTSTDGRARTEHLEAYAQRTFAEQQAQLQFGQINLLNPVLAGARVNGVQWMSEPALSGGGGGARVEGIAATQARVDVHQGGTLIYSTVVPAGPFTLTGIPQLDRRRDLEVTVIEADGSRQTFTVLAATLGLDLPSRGFSVGAGQFRDTSATGREPWVISAGASHPLTVGTSLSGGVLLADGYNAGGAGLSTEPWRGSRAQALLQMPHTAEGDHLGSQASLSLNQQLSERWNASFSVGQQTVGYRELNETLTYGTDSRYKTQGSLGLGWSHPWLGSLSGSYAQSSAFDGSRSGRAQATWGRRVGAASLTATAQWQTAGNAGLGNALYLSASLPLGERRHWRSTWRRSDGQTRLGTGLQEQVNDTLGYRINAERSGRDGQTDFNGGISWLPRVAQMEVGYAGYGQGNSGYSAGMRGAMVLHEEGLTLSPYPLQDTFALLKVGEVAGVRVDTPGGAVWTDSTGQAVVSQLSPYGRSSVQVSTASLPRNVDIQQGATVLQAGRGAVPRVQFPVTLTRRLLLNAVDASGQTLAAGTLVTKPDGTLVTLVQEDGVLFVPNLHESPVLLAKPKQGAPCELRFDVPDNGDPDVYFETAAALCQPVQGSPDDV